jgi:hypothetical protein
MLTFVDGGRSRLVELALHQNTIITSGVIATKSFLVVLDILLLLQVKSRCDSNLKIGKLLQQHKFVAITYNSSLH